MPEVVHIIPASPRAAFILVPLFGLAFLVLIGTVALVALSLKGSQTATFELSGDGLRVRGDLYGRRLSASQLRGGAARVVDLEQEQTLRPRWKTIGTAYPATALAGSDFGMARRRCCTSPICVRWCTSRRAPDTRCC